MASQPTNRISMNNKKDTTVAIVIGQQRRTSSDNNHDATSSSTGRITTTKSQESHPFISTGKTAQPEKQHVCSRAPDCSSSLHEVTNKSDSHLKKKFLINDILQKRTLQEQPSDTLPHASLKFLSFFAQG